MIIVTIPENFTEESEGAEAFKDIEAVLDWTDCDVVVDFGKCGKVSAAALTVMLYIVHNYTIELLNERVRFINCGAHKVEINRQMAVALKKYAS